MPGSVAERRLGDGGGGRYRSGGCRGGAGGRRRGRRVEAAWTQRCEASASSRRKADQNRVSLGGRVGRLRRTCMVRRREAHGARRRITRFSAAGAKVREGRLSRTGTPLSCRPPLRGDRAVTAKDGRVPGIGGRLEISDFATCVPWRSRRLSPGRISCSDNGLSGLTQPALILEPLTRYRSWDGFAGSVRGIRSRQYPARNDRTTFGSRVCERLPPSVYA